MSRQLAHHLFHIMRGSSRRQSLNELKRLGHRKVPVLRFSQIESMLGQAVEQALAAVGVELDDRALGELNAETRARFLALREERDSLRTSVDELLRQQKELSRNRGVLAQELARAETELADRQAPGALDPQAEADLGVLRDELRTRLHALLADSAGEQLATQSVALALAAVDRHRATLLAREETTHAARIEQLRRRIARLRARLEESETLLARARRAARPVDVTISQPDPSLDVREDPQRRALLEELLRMNLELRRLTAAKSVGRRAVTDDAVAERADADRAVADRAVTNPNTHRASSGTPGSSGPRVSVKTPPRAAETHP